MKGSRFSEEQIIGILREQEAGPRRLMYAARTGFQKPRFKWRAKFGGLEVSDAKRLKALEDENGKLKKLLAEAMRDIAVLRTSILENGDARR
jgi:putative transposase